MKQPTKTNRSFDSLNKLNTIKFEYALSESGEYKFFVYDRSLKQTNGLADYETTDYAEADTLFEAMQRFDQEIMKREDGKAIGNTCFGLVDEEKVKGLQDFLQLRNANNELSRAIYIDLKKEKGKTGYCVTAEDMDCSDVLEDNKCPAINSTYKEKKQLHIYEECEDLSSALFNMNETIESHGLDKSYTLEES